MRSRTHRFLAAGFTLIELLVVIAIIAILAAILFPVFAQAKVSAKTAVCISNMKQIGSAMKLYMQDFDDTYAPSVAVDRSDSQGFAPQKLWVGYDNNNRGLVDNYYGNMQSAAKNKPRPGYLQPYLKNFDVTICPMKPSGWQQALAGNFFSPYPSFNGGAYYSRYPNRKYNEWGPMVKELQYPGGAADARAADGSDVDEEANTLLNWEHGARVNLCNFLQTYDWFDSPPPWDDGLKSHFNFLHRDAAVVLFTDTHSKRMAYGQLKRPMFSSRKDIYQ